jgi:hypothetical protein
MVEDKDLVLNGRRVIKKLVQLDQLGRPAAASFYLEGANGKEEVRVETTLTKVPPPGPDMEALYGVCVARFSEEERRALVSELRSLISTSVTSTTALMPMLFFEPDTSLVATVALDYARMRIPQGRGDLEAVYELLQIIEAGRSKNRCALFLGLMTLGDRRVTELLKKHRLSFSREEVKEISIARIQFHHACTIEFYIDWLRDLAGTEDDGRWGSIAGRLLQYAKARPINGVILEQRVKFPSRLEGENNEILRSWSRKEYAARIIPSLVELAEVEPEPKVLPIVIAAWIFAD